ncbi:MAG: sugar phosphate isomerase/epimerase, partial [Cyclobacteriaceae bacterium]|nr:sugar phosphate isomerase/epimerase [Cyclobacteriaceae bacterium]
MKRRNFFKNGMLAASAPLFGSMAFGVEASPAPKQPPFKLNYAPHFGMFKNHTGDDLLDQLQFMADQGFRSMEDNEMKKRSVEDQEKIAKKMQQLGMTMGVFVAHKIYWGKPNLTNGDKDLREEFLAGIRESVEVAKRVNAKWMTVVPGHV